MALARQNLPIVFAGGIDTKSDSKTVVPGKLLSLENGYWQKANRLQKRNGYNVLSTDVKNSSNLITTGEAIGVFDEELNLYTGTRLYTYGEANDAWFDKGKVQSIRVTSNSIVKNAYNQVGVSVATNSNITVYAWEDSRGGVRYSVIDEVTGSNLVYDQSVNATAVRPKVVSIGNDLAICYAVASNTSIRYKLIGINTPSDLGSEVTITSNTNAIQNYDMVVIGTRLFVAYYNDSDTISLQYVDNPSYDISSATTISEAASACIGVCSDDSQNLWVFYSDGSEVAGFIRSYTLASVLAPTTIETTSDTIKAITGAVLDTTATVYYEVDAASSYNNYVSTNTLTLAGVAGTVSDFLRSVGIAAKAFTHNSEIYLPVAHESTLQSTYFIMAQTGEVVAKVNPGNGGGLVSNTMLSEVPQISTNEYIFPNLSKGTIFSEENTIFSLLGVSSTIINFNSDNKFQNVTASGLYIVGGAMQYYDGVSVVEDNFHLYPENVSASVATSGGGLAAGSYQYAVCYEWTDNLGQVHRSAPSIALTVVAGTGSTLSKTGAEITSGSKVITSLSDTTDLIVGQVVTNANLPANAKIVSIDSSSQITLDLAATSSASSQTVSTVYTNKPSVVIPTLRITLKTGDRTDVRLVVYRTRVNLNNFYRVTSVTAPTMNDTTTDTVTFVDTVTDEQLLSRELLYTTGGVIENSPAPSCELITTYKNRIVIAGLEDKLSFGYSKAKVNGSPIEFSDLFYQRIDPRGGDITALGALDDYIVFFKRTSIFVLAGQGPNDTGTQNDFSDPTLITTDAGCDNPNSVVITPQGLMFKSKKGIYLLDRSLTVTYIGAEVEAYNDKNITSSILLEDKNQVRFMTDDDTCLVYDYFFGQWSTFTNHTAEDCAIWGTSFVFLRDTGEVWVETPGSYQDDGSPISLSFTTSWLSMTGLQGFQRVYRMIMLGEYKSPHKLIVDIGYDFNPYYAQTATITPADIYAVDDAYGDETPYGGPNADNTSIYGGEFPLYQFKTHLSRQKCSSIRFRFTDSQSYLDGAYGEGFNMTAMTLEVGFKPQVRKLAAKNSFATS